MFSLGNIKNPGFLSKKSRAFSLPPLSGKLLISSIYQDRRLTIRGEYPRRVEIGDILMGDDKCQKSSPANGIAHYHPESDSVSILQDGSFLARENPSSKVYELKEMQAQLYNSGLISFEFPTVPIQDIFSILKEKKEFRIILSPFSGENFIDFRKLILEEYGQYLSLFKENLLLIAPQARFEDYISGKELRFQYPASSPRYFLYRYTDSTLLDEKTVLENTLFLGAETLYHVLRSLYLNIPFVERHVSFFIQESSGQIQSINQKCSLKNGWNLKEFLHQFKENFSYFTLNSFYHPTEIFKVGEEFRFDIYSHNSFIICQDIQEKNFEKVCIDCDDCTLLCPVHANPRGIFDKQASSFQHTTCIECGICSFICPAHIDFSERISKIKKEKPGVG